VRFLSAASQAQKPAPLVKMQHVSHFVLHCLLCLWWAHSSSSLMKAGLVTRQTVCVPAGAQVYGGVDWVASAMSADETAGGVASRA
jgi:hypothetical protein